MWRKHTIGMLLFLLVVAGWASFYSPYPRPSGRTLTEYHRQHRAEFDQLAQMAGEDASVTALTPDFVRLGGYKSWPEDCEQCFSRRRWAAYKDLFRKLGEYDIDRFYKEDNLLHIPASVEFSDLDSGGGEYAVKEKGYAYSLVEPSRLVDSLDGLDGPGTFYKKIDRHWYLYYNWSIGKPE